MHVLYINVACMYLSICASTLCVLCKCSQIEIAAHAPKSAICPVVGGVCFSELESEEAE